MLHFHPNRALLDRAEGRLVFLENGRDVGVRMAYDPDSMIGIRLYIPRVLGTSSAALFVAPDGEETAVSFPLRFCGNERERELYAVLLDASTLSACGTLFYAHLVLQSIYGPLYVKLRAGGLVHFSPDKQEADFPLFFAKRAAFPHSILEGGAIYALPICELMHLGRLFRGEDEDYQTFFSHLTALGVRAIWLCPPVGKEVEGGRWCPSRLPASFLSFAKKSGICLLFDLLCCTGQVTDDRSGFWNTPVIQNAGEPVAPTTFFTGEGGLLSKLRQAGGYGLYVRGAAELGDAMLSAIHHEWDFGVVLGEIEGDPLPITFGTRRRYLFGGVLDGLVSMSLRQACVEYLAEGRTEGLSRYFGHYLPAVPSGALALQVESLSTYEEGSFYSALMGALYDKGKREDRENAYALAELGYLLASTLPGLPLYLAGEENGLPYPPAPGETTNGQLAYFLRLGQLRRREVVYRQGAFRLLHLSSDLLVFSREREGEALLTVINRSDTALTLASPDGFSVIFGGRGLKNIFSLRPYTGIVVKIACWEGEACRLRFTREKKEKERVAPPVFRGRRATHLAKKA